MKPLKSTAEIMREAAIRRGAVPLVIEGRPVEPGKVRQPKATKPSGNGSKK